LREALPYYQAVLQDLRRSPFPSVAKAQAFMDVARVQRDMKDLSAAAKSYDQAAKEFRRAADERADVLERVKSRAKDGKSQANDVHPEVVRAIEQATTGLRSSLGEYVAVLRQIGKTSDAEKVEKQLAAAAGTQ
jgi:hypothetical protein